MVIDTNTKGEDFDSTQMLIIILQTKVWVVCLYKEPSLGIGHSFGLNAVLVPVTRRMVLYLRLVQKSCLRVISL